MIWPRLSAKAVSSVKVVFVFSCKNLKLFIWSLNDVHGLFITTCKTIKLKSNFILQRANWYCYMTHKNNLKVKFGLNDTKMVQKLCFQKLIPEWIYVISSYWLQKQLWSCFSNSEGKTHDINRVAVAPIWLHELLNLMWCEVFHIEFYIKKISWVWWKND